MKKPVQFLIFLVFFLSRVNTTAQLDSLKTSEQFTKHLTLHDTFFGNEDKYQVCYPKDHRPMFYFIIIFSITSIVLAVLVIYIKHNSNKKLKGKNEIIAEQNKDLIDSINYALRIQQAILPDKKLVDEIFRSGFALFKPKHIVSGDFYWLHKSGNLLFISLMDCTGHGVPGALLTMLGHNAINKAVLEKELVDPSRILDSMNTDVKIALKQTEYSSVQDSMEAAVVCIDTVNGRLLYAGANMGVQIVSNGSSTLLAAGKCSVGSVQLNVVELPKTIEANLQKGDVVYLYTDGFPDQFGGPKGKKFKYKQLEEMLAANAHLPMNEQMEILNQQFAGWKGKLEQVDDVTVIGYKI